MQNSHSDDNSTPYKRHSQHINRFIHKNVDNFGQPKNTKAQANAWTLKASAALSTDRLIRRKDIPAEQRL